MLMTYCEGDWLMRMPDHEDTRRRENATDQLQDQEGVATPERGEDTVNEEARALQNFARRMDTVMLGWMRKARLKEGDQ